MVKELMHASGAQGMGMGQALDILPAKTHDVTSLENMYLLKTAALFKASIKLGALTSHNCTDDDLEILDKFANVIGLAFQIKDDVIDAAKNKTEEKVTYPSLVGLQKSQTKIQELHEQAMLLLDELSHDTFLLKSLVNLILQ
jgi:farnesyl diphosphate synthase